MEPLQSVHTLTSVLRTLVVTALAATAAVACGSASPVPAPSTRGLSGPGFSLRYPITWSGTTDSSGGVSAYELSSHGSLNASGVPAAGAIGVTVLVEPLSVLAAAGARNLATPAQLMTGVVGTPPNAVGVKVATAIHSVRFDGDSAAAVTLTYTTGGTPNVQEDQLDKHGLNVYLVEMDTEPSMQAAGEAVVSSLMKSWAWSSS
jgi:hypothetical protein